MLNIKEWSNNKGDSVILYKECGFYYVEVNDNITGETPVCRSFTNLDEATIEYNDLLRVCKNFGGFYNEMEKKC